jgi:hypothetical protein
MGYCSGEGTGEHPKPASRRYAVRRSRYAANMLFSPVLLANPFQFSAFEIALGLPFNDT